MKKAEILGGDINESTGLTERPNYLSSVIRSYSTSVLTPSNQMGKNNNMTFDLDKISKIFFN